MAVESLRETMKVLRIKMHVGAQYLLGIYCEYDVGRVVIQALQGALSRLLSRPNLVDLKIRHFEDLSYTAW